MHPRSGATVCLVWDLGEDPKEQMDLLSEVPRCFRAAGFCHGSKSTMHRLQYICQVCNIETCACLNSNHIISPRMRGQVGKVSLQQPTLISRIRRNSVVDSRNLRRFERSPRCG